MSEPGIRMTSGGFGPWVDGLDQVERLARIRELRALCMLLVPTGHPLAAALSAALSDPAALEQARLEIDQLAPLPRRRLLSTLAALRLPNIRTEGFNAS